MENLYNLISMLSISIMWLIIGVGIAVIKAIGAAVPIMLIVGSYSFGILWFIVTIFYVVGIFRYRKD